MVHIYNPSPQEAEEVGLCIQGQQIPGSLICIVRLYLKIKNKTKQK
jgi:hypothetical protein